MANLSYYRLLLEGDVNLNKVTSKVTAFNKKIEIGFKYNESDLDKIRAKMKEIETARGNLGKIKIFEAVEGGIGKAVISYTDALGNASRVTEQIIPKFKTLQQRTIDLTSGFETFAKTMKSNFRMVAESFISFGIIYGTINQIKEAIQYVSDLNEEMVKIQVLQVEGAQTNEEIANLALQYNSLAKELGATTIEVASGSVEWLFN